MSKLFMQGKKIAVERLTEAGPNQVSGPFIMPEVSDNLGIIKYSFDKANLPVGTKVYFGDKAQRVKMDGQDLLVMEVDNVLAISEDD